MKKNIRLIIAIVLFLAFFFVHKSYADEFDDFLAEIQSDGYQAYLSAYLDSNNKLFWKSNITVGGSFGNFYGLTGGNFAVLSGSGVYSGLLFNNKNAYFSRNIAFGNFRADLYGGAVHAANSLLDFSGSNIAFSSNSAQDQNGDWGTGGAFYVITDTNLAPSLINFSNAIVNFSSNSAGMGGAVYVSFSTFAFTGGAQVRFSSNTAFGSNKGGGAVLAENNALINFQNAYLVYFTSNYAVRDGGAIYLNNARIDFSDAFIEFVGNRAGGAGGAIYAIGSTIVFRASDPVLFLDNRSAVQEGNDIFLDNSFLSLETVGYPIRIYGGIKALRGSQFSFSNISAGGFLYLSGVHVFDAMIAFDLSQQSLIDIASASFFYSSSKHMELKDATIINFYNSTAVFFADQSGDGQSGGALSLRSSKLNFIKSSITFNANSAVLSGGAVFVYKSTVLFQNSSVFAFGNNAASGGAFYLEDSRLDFLNALADFYGNNAVGLNDFYLSNAVFNIDNSRLSLKSGIQSYLSSEIIVQDSQLLLGGNNVFRGSERFELNRSTLNVSDASFLYEENDLAFSLTNSSAHFHLTIASFGANASEGSAYLSSSFLSAELSSMAFFGSMDFLEQSSLRLNKSFLLFNERTFFDDPIVFDISHSTVLVRRSSFAFERAQSSAINAKNSRLAFLLSSASFTDNVRISDRGGGVFDAELSNLSFTGSSLHFINNKAQVLAAQGGDGGVFYLGNSEISFISATVHIASNSAALKGGAFYMSHGRADFLQANVFITSNIAGGSGGAFYIDNSSIGFQNTSFDLAFNRAAIDGGAIFAGSGEILFGNISGSFSNNKASGRGGALFLDDSIVSFSIGADLIFRQNEAGGISNDIFMTGSRLSLDADQFQIRMEGGIDAQTSSFIYSNAAGGGLSLSGINKFKEMLFFDLAEQSSITVLNAEFSYLNSSLAKINLNISRFYLLSSTAAFKGIKTIGAIALDHSIAVFADSLVDFSSNTSLSGGALSLINSSTMSFRNSTVLFSSNVSLGLGLSDGGGAIFAGSKSSISFIDSDIVFYGNESKTSGGSVFADGKSRLLFLRSTAIFENSKGGALAIADGSTMAWKASSAVFVKSLGGAVKVFNTSLLDFDQADVLFEGNSNELSGGALSIDNAVAAFSGGAIVVNNNQSSIFGGAFYVINGATVKFENMTLKAEGNTSVSSGAVFYIAQNSSISIRVENQDIVFRDNKAFAKSNDVYIQDGKLYLISYGGKIILEGGIVSDAGEIFYGGSGGSLYLSGINDFKASALNLAQGSSITVANASFTYRNSDALLLIESSINFLSSRVSFHDNIQNIQISSSFFLAQNSILNFQDSLNSNNGSITIRGGHLFLNGKGHFEMSRGLDFQFSSATIENAIWDYINSLPMTVKGSTIVFEGAFSSLTFLPANIRNQDLVFSQNAQVIFNADTGQEVWINNGIRSVGEGSFTKTGLGIILFKGANSRMMNSAFVLKQGSAIFMSAKTTMTALIMSYGTSLEMRSANFLGDGFFARNEIAILSPFISSGIFYGFDFFFAANKSSADFLSVRGQLDFAWTSTVTARLNNFEDSMRIMGTSIAFMSASNDPDIENLWLILEGAAAGDGDKFSMIVGSRRIWLVYIGGWNAFVRAYKLASGGGIASLLKDIKPGDDESPPLAFFPNINERNFTVFGNKYIVNSDYVEDMGFVFSRSSGTFRDINFSNFNRSSGAVMIVQRSTIIFTRHIGFFGSSAAVSSGGAIFAGEGANIRFINAQAFLDLNHAGGGGFLYAQEARVFFTSGSVKFSSNSAMRGGAILAAQDSDIRFSSGAVYFTSNSAQAGGAIFAREAGVLFGSGTVIFSSNSARFGGALYIGAGSDIKFINGSPAFIGNAAISSGGAVLVQEGSLFLENPIFRENRAADLPNDIFLKRARLDISAKAREARFEGGIVATDNSEISFMHKNGGTLFLSGINKIQTLSSFNIADRSAITADNASFEYTDNSAPFSLSANSAFIFKHSTGTFLNNSNGGGDMVLMSRSKALFEFSKFQAGAVLAQNLSLLSFKDSSVDISEAFTAQNASMTFSRSNLTLTGEIALRVMRNFDLNLSSAEIINAYFLFERSFALRQSVLTFKNSDINFNSAEIDVFHSTVNILGGGDRALIVFGGFGSMRLRASLLLLDTNVGAGIGGLNAQASVVDINGSLSLSALISFDASSLILRQGSTLELVQSSFSYLNGEALGLDNVSFNFTGRFARWQGNVSSGAIRIESSDVEFKDGEISFLGNRSESGGAIFSKTSAPLRFINNRILFEGNLAASSGGAIYQEQASAMDFSGGSMDFVGNSALWGGAVFLPISSRMDFADASISFLQNNAGASGGAIYLEHSSASFMGGSLIFSTNVAISSGGAVFAIDRSYFLMSGGAFFGNTSYSLGGAIYAENSRIKISNTDFIGNNAESGNDIYLKDGSDLELTVFSGAENVMDGGIVSEGQNQIFKRGDGTLRFLRSANIKLSVETVLNIEQGLIKFEAAQSTIGMVNISESAGLGIWTDLRRASLLYFSTISIGADTRLFVDTIRPAVSTGMTIDFLYVGHKEAGDLFNNANIFAGEYQYSFNWRGTDGDWIGYLKYLGQPIWESSYTIKAADGAFYADLMGLSARTSFNFDVLDKIERTDSLWIIGGTDGENLGWESDNSFGMQNSGVKVGIDLINDGGIFVGYSKIQAQNGLSTADGSETEMGFYKVWRGQKSKVNAMISGAINEIRTDNGTEIKSQAIRAILEVETEPFLTFESWRMSPFIGIHVGYAAIEKMSLQTNSWRYPGNPQELLMAEFPQDKQGRAVLELPAFTWMRVKGLGGIKWEMRKLGALRLGLKLYGGSVILGNRPKFKTSQIELEGTSGGDFFAGTGLAFEYRMMPELSLILGGTYEMSDRGNAFSANLGVNLKLGAARGDTWGPIVKAKAKAKAKVKVEVEVDDELIVDGDERIEKIRIVEKVERKGIVRSTQARVREGGIVRSTQARTGENVRLTQIKVAQTKDGGEEISIQERKVAAGKGAGTGVAQAVQGGQQSAGLPPVPKEAQGSAGFQPAPKGGQGAQESQPQINIIINELSQSEIKQGTKRVFRIYASDFISSSGRLKNKMKAQIRLLVQVIMREGYTRIAVEGHTDSAGDEGINLALQKERTATVFKELMGLGIPEDDMDYLWIGSRKPIASDQTPAGRNLNSRVEIRIE